jgi:hypothetical protein
VPVVPAAASRGLLEAKDFEALLPDALRPKLSEPQVTFSNMLRNVFAKVKI